MHISLPVTSLVWRSPKRAKIAWIAIIQRTYNFRRITLFSASHFPLVSPIFAVWSVDAAKVWFWSKISWLAMRHQYTPYLSKLYGQLGSYTHFVLPHACIFACKYTNLQWVSNNESNCPHKSKFVRFLPKARCGQSDLYIMHDIYHWYD